MTPEKQRIAIAEACGWMRFFEPDYLNDLNAMHEAVKTLNLNQWSDYMDTLYGIVQDPHICPTTHQLEWVEATAPQRAEAFLRTIGKWEESTQPDLSEVPDYNSQV